MEAPEDQHSMSEYGGRQNKYTSILSKSMLFQAFTVNAHVSTCSFLVRLWAQNWGCSLSSKPLLFTVHKCMVWGHKSGPSVVLSSNNY